MKFNWNHSFFMLILLLITFSCGKKKQELVAKYKIISQHVEEGDFDLFFDELDEVSQNYVNFLIDTSKLSNKQMWDFGDKHELGLFTASYHKNWEKVARAYPGENSMFFIYLNVSGVSMFSSRGETKILEKETVIGKENYIVVAKKADKNAYITSKIHFTKNGEGELKLNLLSLLSLEEKLLNQSFKRYFQGFQINRELAIGRSNDMVFNFLEDMSNPEYQLEYITYDKRQLD